MTKKIIFSLFLAMTVLAVPCVPYLETENAQSKTKAYYLGDAVNYNGDLIVGSTNMGALEIFKLENGKLARKSSFRSFRAQYSGYDDFYDMLFNKEGTKLYVYAVDGRYLYKYDATDLSRLQLIEQIKDNSWDWFMGLEKAGDYVATIGAKSLKIWNEEMQVIDSYNLTNSERQHNIAFTADRHYIFNAANSKLQIFDTQTRQKITEFAVSNRNNNSQKVYNDGVSGKIYVADDEALKEFDFSGRITKRFNHTSALGYDVAGLSGKDYLYFSDGIGIVKINKSDLKPVKWAYTTDLGEAGGWAMGLKVVSQGNGEKVVVFNNSSILVMDENLKYVAHYKASAEETKTFAPLSLKADKTRAPANAQVAVHGSGWGINETVEISFAGGKWEDITNEQGEFSRLITVPADAKGGNDIIVQGKTTGIKYHLGFKVE